MWQIVRGGCCVGGGGGLADGRIWDSFLSLIPLMRRMTRDGSLPCKACCARHTHSNAPHARARHVSEAAKTCGPATGQGLAASSLGAGLLTWCSLSWLGSRTQANGKSPRTVHRPLGRRWCEQKCLIFLGPATGQGLFLGPATGQGLSLGPATGQGRRLFLTFRLALRSFDTVAATARLISRLAPLARLRRLLHTLDQPPCPARGCHAREPAGALLVQHLYLFSVCLGG